MLHPQQNAQTYGVENGETVDSTLIENRKLNETNET